MILCVALIGQQNQPLYLRTFPETLGEHLLKLNFVVHCSLDAVDDKVVAKRAPGEVPDTYLGLLYPTDDFKVYGLLSSTGIKFILVLDELPSKDDHVSRVLRKLHALYVDTSSNPFFAFGMPITSAKFNEGVEAAVDTYGR